MKGRVPASVVIPGTYNKNRLRENIMADSTDHWRKPSTDLKTSLNDALRDFNVSVKAEVILSLVICKFRYFRVYIFGKTGST